MSEFHGVLLVDKPEGMTSHDVVGAVRRKLGQKSVGHAGTLDPLATGLLVLLCGKATKISDYILNGDKGYIVKVQLGINTDTDDITGEVTQKKDASHLSESRIREAVDQLRGALQLPVPIYSAIKSKGKKLYEMARKNIPVEAPVREMTFHNVDIIAVGESWVEVQLGCSKGSYIRSWAKELGQILAVGAVVEELRRDISAPYTVEDGIPLEELQAMDLVELETSPSWVPLNRCLPNWPAVKIEGQEEKLLINGQIARRLERFLEIQYGRIEPQIPGVKVLSRRSGRLISLLSHDSPLNFKIRRVFHTQ